MDFRGLLLREGKAGERRKEGKEKRKGEKEAEGEGGTSSIPLALILQSDLITHSPSLFDAPGSLLKRSLWN